MPTKGISNTIFLGENLYLPVRCPQNCQISNCRQWVLGASSSSQRAASETIFYSKISNKLGCYINFIYHRCHIKVFFTKILLYFVTSEVANFMCDFTLVKF